MTQRPDPSRLKAHPVQPEFSRMISADRVTQDETVERIVATPAEREALAGRLELQALDQLDVELRLKRVRGGQVIRVSGRIAAEVVQTCVVTLNPVRNRIDESFVSYFAPAHMVRQDVVELDIDPEAEEEPEALQDGGIDVGELATQYLSLALDPYPRCPDVEFGGYFEGG